MERTYKKIISEKNLTLAWQRILARSNISYKNFFRPLYNAYAIAIKENIHRLHERLHGSWKPGKILYIYTPKASGLQRMITLLPIEDQIVLQAIANIFAEKIYERRKLLDYKVIFSYILNKPKNSIFFLENWRLSYKKFHEASLKYFNKGNKWIVDFDLAAFFDTISHTLLTQVMAPNKGQSETWSKVGKWLEHWSSLDKSLLYQHGIPQGPIASNLLAECFLLDLDELMAKECLPYLRYVDDIRIFASNKIKAFNAVIKLDEYCKSKGLIPQSNKLTIKKIDSIDELLKFQPSQSYIQATGLESPEAKQIDKNYAERLIKSSLTGKPYSIQDKTKFKYAIYRAPRSAKIVKWIALLLPRHPEYVDDFVNYLFKYGKNKEIEKTIDRIIKNDEIPYEYVQGELWRVMAMLASPSTRRSLILKAKEIAIDLNKSPILRKGVCIFLLTSQKTTKSIQRIFLKQESLVQASLCPYIPDTEFDKPKGFVKKLLKSKDYEVGISLIKKLIQKRKTHTDFNLKTRDLSPEVQNALKELGIIKRRSMGGVDVIGEILSERYKINNSYNWRKIFKTEYAHALSILAFGDRLFDAAPSTWLQHQDSFNDLLTRCMAEFFTKNRMPSPKTIDIKRQKIKYGSLLDNKQVLQINYPAIFGGFKKAHDRRNFLPASHPYDEKKGFKTTYLGPKERNVLKKELKKSYTSILSTI
jgi:hypothetical protein